MKILVLGSEGSLMQAVIPKLLAKGHEVVGIDNLFRYNERRNSAKIMDYMFYNHDLNYDWDEEPLYHLLNCDVVIQAAARIFGVGGFHKYNADILSYDVQIQHNMLSTLTSMTSRRPHIVYISSSMVYESCPPMSDFGVTEDLPEFNPVPKTEYGLSKYVGERMVKAYNDQYGFNYTIWRPFNIITPFEPAEEEMGISHVFADFLKNIIVEKKNPLPIIGDGEQIRCFTWIDDVANGIVDNLDNPAAINETFNLGNVDPISMKTLANLIYYAAINKGLLPDTATELKFETVKEYSDDVRVRIPNSDKAKKLLGWHTTVGTPAAINICIDHLTNK